MFHHGSLLSVRISRAVHGQKLAFCRDYLARVKPHSVLCSLRGGKRESGRGLHARWPRALIGKVGWKRRGDTIEGTSGSVERARDGGKFDADAVLVGPLLERFSKKGPSFTTSGSLRGGANKGNRCALRVFSP